MKNKNHLRVFMNPAAINKRGAMNLSFGMIFSIIMIILFITFAFYAIQKFLSLQNMAQTGKFANDLQNDVDRMWKSSQGEQEYKYSIPGKIKYVCFANYKNNDESRGRNAELFDEIYQAFFEEENLFFYPLGSGEGFDSVALKHIDIEKTTEDDNPNCFENIKGEIKLTLKKDFNEALVTIE